MEEELDIDSQFDNEVKLTFPPSLGNHPKEE